MKHHDQRDLGRKGFIWLQLPNHCLSLKEISYKLCQKGVSKRLIEDYIAKHEEELLEYELQSAKKIWNKKIQNVDENSVKEFLYKKGYTQETIQKIQ